MSHLQALAGRARLGASAIGPDPLSRRCGLDGLEREDCICAYENARASSIQTLRDSIRSATPLTIRKCRQDAGFAGSLKQRVPRQTVVPQTRCCTITSALTLHEGIYEI